MAAPALRPETTEERVIFHCITWTWAYWLIGALYILAPVVGWCLAVLAVRRYVTGEDETRGGMPAGVIVWIAGMIFMLIALIFGHVDYGLGVGMIIKSSVGWAKGWALMAVFPFIGAMTRIRASIIYRATNILALQTLLLVPLFVFSAFIHLPSPLYTSPLQIVGGPGPEYFSVEFYGIDDTTNGWRWRFFAPWSPAAAFVANMSFVFAMYERDAFWKWIGIIGSVVVCLMTASRLALVVLPGVLILTFFVANLTRPLTAATAAVGGTMSCFALPQLLFAYEQLMDRFNGARAASTRVRAVLRSIALHRWETEAPIFGHGAVEKGPHIVEFMPIGSHHTWFGLLFVKGAVGLLALAIPLAWSISETVVKAQADRVGRAAFGVVVVLTFYTFGENLEILSYLFWPGLVVMGISMRRRVYNPLRGALGS
jgi:hypothetical protein